MADFKQAMQWMEEGKKVRSKAWGNKDYYWYVDDRYSFDNLWCIKQPNGKETCMIRSFIEATDWEIYCEKHDWEGICADPKEETFRCKNCEEYKIEYKYPQESLSDKECTGWPGKPFYHGKDLKEKIQNAQNRLNKEMYLTLENGNIMDKIFLEEFGDKLIERKNV